MADDTRAAPFTKCLPCAQPKALRPWKGYCFTGEGPHPGRRSRAQLCLRSPHRSHTQAWAGVQCKVGNQGPSGGVWGNRAREGRPLFLCPLKACQGRACPPTSLLCWTVCSLAKAPYIGLGSWPGKVRSPSVCLPPAPQGSLEMSPWSLGRPHAVGFS